MSIALKGIDLPKEGLITNVNILSNGDVYVNVLDGKRANFEVLGNSAIQIPKDHGRIGDIDEIIKSLPTEYLGSTVHAIINEAPTILESEK